MRSLATSQPLRQGLRFVCPVSQSLSSRIRRSSTQTSLVEQITSRPANYVYDYLSPTNSHLLNISLADFLPEKCYPFGFKKSNLTLPVAKLDGDPTAAPYLPEGHHLVYFPPQIPSSDLLPDGTDPLQSPGFPYVRRMWAGGSLVFRRRGDHQAKLNCTRAVCKEKITDVVVKGQEENEKVFVTIERRVGLLPELGRSSGDLPSTTSTLERRNIVFMKEKTLEAAKRDASRPDKIVKPLHTPDVKVPITPSQSLLFRFSALTFNAHGIHLDPQYCRDLEGHRNLLVHGPLSLVLMLSVLRSQLKSDEMILRLDYRNLAPLYATETLNVCVRRDPEVQDRVDLWVEGSGGGFAVKATALLGKSGSTEDFEGSGALDGF